jgi:hypothetical protein
MSLARRSKVRVHAEVDFQLAALEPAATARGEIGGFQNLRNAQNLRKERASARLPAGRHRELYVIETNDPHGHGVYAASRAIGTSCAAV